MEVLYWLQLAKLGLTISKMILNMFSFSGNNTAYDNQSKYTKDLENISFYLHLYYSKAVEHKNSLLILYDYVNIKNQLKITKR